MLPATAMLEACAAAAAAAVAGPASIPGAGSSPTTISNAAFRAPLLLRVAPFAAVELDLDTGGAALSTPGTVHVAGAVRGAVPLEAAGERGPRRLNPRVPARSAVEAVTPGRSAGWGMNLAPLAGSKGPGADRSWPGATTLTAAMAPCPSGRHLAFGRHPAQTDAVLHLAALAGLESRVAAGVCVPVAAAAYTAGPPREAGKAAGGASHLPAALEVRGEKDKGGCRAGVWDARCVGTA